jgi:hypothetical protein
MTAPVQTEPIAAEQLETLLPLIAAYQRFYEVEEIDDARNRAFFRRFLAPSDDGMLIGAWREGELVGYACLYWHFSSTDAAEERPLRRPGRARPWRRPGTDRGQRRRGP